MEVSRKALDEIGVGRKIKEEKRWEQTWEEMVSKGFLESPTIIKINDLDVEKRDLHWRYNGNNNIKIGEAPVDSTFYPTRSQADSSDLPESGETHLISQNQ